MVVLPTVEWVQQDPLIDPSGFRNIDSGAAGFIKQLDTGAGGVLDFGTVNITGSGNIADTYLAYARASAMGDASGIFNMRFFLTDVSSFNEGFYRFLERKEFHFQQGGIQLGPADENTPSNVPNTTNFSGTITEPEYPLGKPWVSGILDNDVTQYVYLSFIGGVDVPVGTYGGAGAGTFRYRLLYDFS